MWTSSKRNTNLKHDQLPPICQTVSNTDFKLSYLVKIKIIAVFGNNWVTVSSYLPGSITFNLVLVKVNETRVRQFIPTNRLECTSCIISWRLTCPHFSSDWIAFSITIWPWWRFLVQAANAGRPELKINAPIPNSVKCNFHFRSKVFKLQRKMDDQLLRVNLL